MARKSALRLEQLENRTVPAIFGIPWADGRHLTFSIVPDGASLDGAGSNLLSTMSSADPSGRWLADVLRAVETWSAVANINVNVIADSGDPLGAVGAPQGDSRFGDIRLSARPLSDNVLAMTTPSGFLGGTRVGDIVLNSNGHLNVGGGANEHDVYTVMLQEVGHALGVANSTDPASVMYEAYSGVRTGLTASDVASIQALYGARAADGFESNESLGNAKELSRPSGSTANASIVIQGDITTAQDVDYFKVKTASSNPNGLSFRVNAGVGLFAPKVTVYDPYGAVVGATQSYYPQLGELSVSLSSVKSSAYYTVKVEDANPAFAIGGYQLKVVFDPNAPDVTAAGAAALDDAHTNDTADKATQLSTAAGYASNTRYSTLATLRDATDVDYYRIRSASIGTNQPNVLTVNVRAQDATALAPALQVYNKDKQLVSATILANGNGTYTIQLAGAESNQDYFVAVAAGNAGGTGAYQLDVDFRSQVINLESFADGSLTSAASTGFSTLTANRGQVMHFLLSANAGNSSVQSGVRMTIFDSEGHVVNTLFAKSGQTVSMATYLAQGTYTLRFDGLTPAGVALPNLNYSLQGVTLTDPIGPTGSDPTLSDGSAANNYDWTQLSSDYYSSLLFDTVTDVVW